jgi:hypothetical protein
MMKNIVYLFLLFALFGCKDWDDYYNIPDGTLQTNLWETISGKPEFSSFVKMVKDYSLDTLFYNNLSYTIFIPSNEGVDSVDFTETDPVIFLQNHISNTVFLTRNLAGNGKLKVLSGKYAVIEESDDGYLFNASAITGQSSLHANGLYYTLQGASGSYENLFQYLEKLNPYIADYIRMQDSVYLDLEKSRPISINEQGNIVYDSVKIHINLFERLYFPVSEEFRNSRATMVIPTSEQYLAAMEKVKMDLGLAPSFEMPLVWQHRILIPFILNQGIFDGSLETEAFNYSKMKNILGDSVIVDYNPVSKVECSNGIFYKYDQFAIPDSLYLRGYRKEGESLVIPQGLDKYAWKDSRFVKVSGTSAFAPVVQRVFGIASNDSVLFVDFGNRFNGQYTIEFKIEDVFPGKYQFIWRSNPRNGGLYSVYINDKLQTLSFNFTQFDMAYLSGGVVSVTGTQYFYPQNGYNRLDCLTTLEEYGDVWVKIKYMGPGMINSSGLIIDYVELIPYK